MAKYLKTLYQFYTNEIPEYYRVSVQEVCRHDGYIFRDK